jgi:pilus assembly protein CpaB
MDKRFVGALIFAFFVAAGVSFALYRLVSNTQPVLAPAPTEKLVLASHDIEPGTILRDGDVVLADWPAQAPTNAFSHTQDVVGRGVTAKIYAKEAILASRLAPQGAGSGLAAVIPPGMRAVWLPEAHAPEGTGIPLLRSHRGHH